MKLFKLYTISRNGRLNVWECDTKLNELIKKPKYENLENEELGVDSDELSNRKFAQEEKKEDEKMETNSDDENEAEKVPLIGYKKKSK
jgi:hypothetical protein